MDTTYPGARGLRMLRLLVALFGVLGVAALAPQLASADAPGAIGGTVTNVAGAAVPNIQVQLNNLDTGNFYEANTGNDGTYLIGNLTPGRYQVYFRPLGQNYVYQFYPDKSNAATAQPVVVTSGQTTPNINATLATGATVSGQVTDAAGHPVSQAYVNVYDYGGSYPNQVYTTQAVTDANGDWSVDALPTGTYEVFFSPPNGSNYATQYYNNVGGQDPPTPITLTAGSITPNINAALTAGGQISGMVKDGNGPAAGVQVEAVDAMGFTYGNSATTDSQGNYTLTGLSPSSAYRVEFFPPQGSTLASEFYPSGSTVEEATPVSVTVGQTTPNINETLSQGGSISGVVTAAATGYPIAGVPVTLTDDAGQQVASTFNLRTQGDGTYDFTNLPPGSYKVQFSAEGALAFQYYNDASTLSAATSVNVGAGQAVTNINAALTQGGTLKGTVTDPSTGQAVPDAIVDVLDANDNVVTYGFTDPNGHYEISGIAPGSYYVEALVFSGNSFTIGISVGVRVGFYGASGTLAGATPVTVATGATTAGIDVALQPRSATPPNIPTPVVPPAMTPPPATTTPPAPPTGQVINVVPGPPTLSGATLSGLGKGKPVIRFHLASGSNGAPKLRSFKVRLPQGLAFVASQLRKGVKVTGGGKATEKLIGGQLVVTLGSPSRTLSVSIGAPALKVSGQLSAKVANRRAGTLRVIVTVLPVNQAGHVLSFRVKNPS